MYQINMSNKCTKSFLSLTIMSEKNFRRNDFEKYSLEFNLKKNFVEF